MQALTPAGRRTIGSPRLPPSFSPPTAMHVVRGLDAAEPGRGRLLAIGNFDGVHRGHQRILSTLVRRALAAGLPATAMTFDPHPIQLLAPQRAPPHLTTLARKTELIARCGVDELLIVETTPALLQLTPREFFEQVVVGQLHAHGLVEGPNFCFGRDRAGDVAVLASLCHSAGATLEVVEPVSEGDVIVSSSSIRRAIGEGRLQDAVAMLGHAYQVSGRVVAGAQRGREIGFPTANLAEVANLLPPDGVYAGVCDAGGTSFPAAVHLGPNPTFGEQLRKLEVHLVGYSGSLYDAELAVELLAEVRGTRTFSGREALVTQLQQDVARVVAIADECRGSRT